MICCQPHLILHMHPLLHLHNSVAISNIELLGIWGWIDSSKFLVSSTIYLEPSRLELSKQDILSIKPQKFVFLRIEYSKGYFCDIVSPRLNAVLPEEAAGKSLANKPGLGMLFMPQRSSPRNIKMESPALVSSLIL